MAARRPQADLGVRQPLLAGVGGREGGRRLEVQVFEGCQGDRSETSDLGGSSSGGGGYKFAVYFDRKEEWKKKH